MSGGLDSAVTLYLAGRESPGVNCLIFDYGQRHKREIEAAKEIARRSGSPCRVIELDFPWKGSSLLDEKVQIPIRNNEITKQPNNEIPSTYVPGRNIIFLSYAVSFAEAIGAGLIYIGAHAQDYSGYPDCRPQFYRAFRRAVACGTKAGLERRIQIKTPLINKAKAEIIRIGARLKVPFELTWSCYQGGSRPCARCDSCYYRSKGFSEAGLSDPLLAR